MTLTVFGRKPKDAIFLGDQPFAVRNDCQVGQWKVGDDGFRGNRIEISIVKAAKFFGSLGKAKDTFWLQLFFILAPGCKELPRDTICVTYLKTRSLGAFNQKIIELMDNGEPAEGIFIGSFLKHTNDYGNYFSVAWNWRSRETEDEKKQLEQIIAFMESRPLLYDLSATKGLIPLEGLSEPEIQLLVESAQSARKSLPEAKIGG